ncbi:hypothetical protein GCM10017600_39060 [Streptosporangium carneum]|uniref:Uncharacterized protein n=1 Tax=Streptosporangium carneum TaxID=47481 RepID=A0A9W6I1Y6_9ACTN|nr:hypothetical protein GCM10017600_39060 [Streptosporangium carneum]
MDVRVDRGGQGEQPARFHHLAPFRSAFQGDEAAVFDQDIVGADIGEQNLSHTG